MAKLEADFNVGDLYDFICEDLRVDDELAGQIDASMDTFTSEVRWLRFSFSLRLVFAFRFTQVLSVQF